MLSMHKSPALVARYRKNPSAVEKRFRLNAQQVKALRSGSLRRINARLAAEGAFIRIHPHQGKVFNYVGP